MSKVLKPLLEKLKAISGTTATAQYISYLNFFRNVKFPVPRTTLIKSGKLFFRVRTHNASEILFSNEDELSYRHDLFNITNFGRCNEPFQSVFYCSDNPILSFSEVSSLTRKMEKRNFAFHTTSVWQIKEDIVVSYILQDEKQPFGNDDLSAMTIEFDEVINDPRLLGDKDDLRVFLDEISQAFKKPFSSDPYVYLLSAAYFNYLMGITGEGGEKFDGFVYSTCLGEPNLMNVGLNHTFRNEIVGFGKKIECVDVYRSKLELIEGEYFETETVHCNKIDHSTSEVYW